jgi:hypothetical protein
MSVESPGSVAEAKNRAFLTCVVNEMRLGEESDKNVQPTRRTIAIAHISTRQCIIVPGLVLCQS